MADFNPIFEIDAGKILAKLHLAGQQQVQGNVTVINTAIKNPVDNANPEQAGDTLFDLENKSGEYELAIVDSLEFIPTYELSCDEKFAELFEQYNKIKEKNGDNNSDDKKTNDKDSKNDKKQDDKNASTSLTAKTKDKDDAQKNESIQHINKKILSLIFEDTNNDNDKKEDTEENKELIDIQKKILERCDEYSKHFIAGKSYKKDDKNFEESYKSFEKAIEEENEGRIKQKNEQSDKLKKRISKYFYDYFTTFAGKDNAKKINEKDVVIRPIDASDDKITPSSFDKINDYKIEVDDKVEKEIEQKIDEARKDEKQRHDTIKYQVALIVGYKVDTEY